MSSHQSGIKDLFFNSSVCRNLTMAEDRFCENDGDKSIIDKNIYPAMNSTCLRPCTQVYVLKDDSFQKKIVRSPTLLLLSPTKTDGWKMILFVGESTLFCKLFLITTSYLKRLKTSLYRPLLLQPINVPFEIPYPFKFPFNLSLWYNIYYLFDSRRMLLLK